VPGPPYRPQSRIGVWGWPASNRKKKSLCVLTLHWMCVKKLRGVNREVEIWKRWRKELVFRRARGHPVFHSPRGEVRERRRKFGKEKAAVELCPKGAQMHPGGKNTTRKGDREQRCIFPKTIGSVLGLLRGANPIH